MRRMCAYVVALAGCGFTDLQRRDASSSDAIGDSSMSSDAMPEDGAVDDAMTVACPATNACEAPTLLASQDGDAGAGTQSVQGNTSAWHRLRVNESDSSIFAESMKLRATLTAPAGSDFDVVLYLNQQSDQIECATEDVTGSVMGATDVAQVEWGETGTNSNSQDDSRTVSIEVRYVSGPCETWTLVVEGNKP